MASFQLHPGMQQFKKTGPHIFAKVIMKIKALQQYFLYGPQCRTVLTEDVSHHVTGCFF